MTPTKPPLLVPPAPVIDKDFVCRQMLEVADLARERNELGTALEALGMIAEIQGMIDDPHSV